MSRIVDEQPPGSTLRACCRHTAGLVVFVHARDAHYWPQVHVLCISIF